MIGTPRELSNYLWQLDENKKYEIKEHKEKRSLNANSYCWTLIGKIAEVLGTTKIEVYKQYILDKGIYRVITMNKEAVDTFIRVWTQQGLGWLCETSENNIKGLVDVVAYYGTSSYNSKQMANFIDYVVEEAKELGIQTLTPNQIADLKSSWSASNTKL